MSARRRFPRRLPAVDFFRNSATVQITTPSRARHLDEYTQNVLEEETRYDDTDWLTLMMIYSGTGFLADANAKDKNNRPGASRGVPSCPSHDAGGRFFVEFGPFRRSGRGGAL